MGNEDQNIQESSTVEEKKVINKKLIIAVISVVVVAALAVGGYFGYQAYKEYTYKQQFVVKLRTFYEEFSARLNSYLAAKGCPKNLTCEKIVKEGFYDSFAKENLGAMKICGVKKGGNCMPDRYKILRGGLWANMNEWDGFKFLSSNGASVIMKNNGTCRNYSVENKAPLNCVLGYIFVDVNGPVDPNIYGRDLFYFYLTKSGEIVPMGVKDDKVGYWKTSKGKCDPKDGNGEQCAARIIEQNWKMNY
ncbi:MAG: hypothetical protein PHX18_00540 [Candidatus Gastranaerophilales bacterium]|nr:hypothetical protein [Candidatus Gastranaerophilales bacterium]